MFLWGSLSFQTSLQKENYFFRTRPEREPKLPTTTTTNTSSDKPAEPQVPATTTTNTPSGKPTSDEPPTPYPTTTAHVSMVDELVAKYNAKTLNKANTNRRRRSCNRSSSNNKFTVYFNNIRGARSKQISLEKILNKSDVDPDAICLV